MKVSVTGSCRCVYCRGTRASLAEYAAELELLAYVQAEALKRYGTHEPECGMPPASIKTMHARVQFAKENHCTCGFDAAIQRSAAGYDRLHLLAGSYRCSPRAIRRGRTPTRKPSAKRRAVSR